MALDEFDLTDETGWGYLTWEESKRALDISFGFKNHQIGTKATWMPYLRSISD